MSLLVSEEDLIEITVHYEVKNNKHIFYEDKKEGTKSENFYFKRPSWGDQREIYEYAFGLDVNGAASLNPYRFVDGKIKVLLKKWSLGCPVTEEAIDRLNPFLVSYLDKKVDKVIIVESSDEHVNNGPDDKQEKSTTDSKDEHSTQDSSNGDPIDPKS